METENHEYYVSPEVAKLLKEAGFDWKEYLKPLSIYDGGGSVWKIPLHIAQRWLREVKRHDVFVSPCNGLYFYTVRKYYHEGKVDYFDYPNKDAFDTYEEALEAGIKKALEIILEKGE